MKSRLNKKGKCPSLIIVLLLVVIIDVCTACSSDGSTTPVMEQTTEPSTPSDSSPSPSPLSSPDSELLSDSTFSVHFIDVGLADAALGIGKDLI